MRKRKVLVVGQTPPPYGGQMMMIKRLIDAKFEHVEIIHVRMAFSSDVNEIGKTSLRKIFHLFAIVFRIWGKRLTHRRLILYYPPAGPNKVPVIRDLILLFFTRFFFSKKIYHFRAAGISEYLAQHNPLFKKIAKWIYGKPDLAIQLSSLNPADGGFFSARSIRYIPNGLEDLATGRTLSRPDPGKKVSILFIGILREDKGLNVLLEAAALLIDQGITNININVIGGFSSESYKREIKQLTTHLGINSFVSFKGVLIGSDKINVLEASDIFCFPSYFDSESFGNVLVEALMFGLPIVATKWRGIPDIVSEDVGFLVNIKDSKAVAEKLKLLVNDAVQRERMGRCARDRYENHYQLAVHLKQMETAILSI